MGGAGRSGEARWRGRVGNQVHAAVWVRLRVGGARLFNSKRSLAESV